MADSNAPYLSEIDEGAEDGTKVELSALKEAYDRSQAQMRQLEDLLKYRMLDDFSTAAAASPAVQAATRTSEVKLDRRRSLERRTSIERRVSQTRKSLEVGQLAVVALPWAVGCRRASLLGSF